MSDEKVFMSGPEIVQSDAARLIGHHLELAAAIFEALPEGCWQSIIRELKDKGAAKPAIMGAEVFMAELESYYRDLDRDYP